MAGATSKTSVKSVIKKTSKAAAAKSSKLTKVTAKASIAKPSTVKNSAVKKSTKSVSVAVKPKSTAAKSAVKAASQSKLASVVKTKADPASKPKTTPSVKITLKPESAKKTVKAEITPKTKKNVPAKTASTKNLIISPSKLAGPAIKQNANVKAAVKKADTFVDEPETASKPKAKRATKFMTKGNAPIIAQLRQQLLQRRNEIISSSWRDLGSAYVGTQASGDSADAAMDAVHSEMRSQLAEKESQELSSIDNALHKMETGEYGLCEECGMPIAIERLEAIPDAELCLKCQEELEEDGDYDNYSYYGYD